MRKTILESIGDGGSGLHPAAPKAVQTLNLGSRSNA
jgi:hypothetical protein